VDPKLSFSASKKRTRDLQSFIIVPGGAAAAAAGGKTPKKNLQLSEI